jgi:uncharacterized protein YbaP (TraB family)
MFRRPVSRFFVVLLALGPVWVAAESRAGTACVWKVTGRNGGIAYLGGSLHALRKTDFPLPAAYMRAFDASSRMAFEVDAKALKESSESLVKAGKYPGSDSLKNHVDPRTYAYMRRLFGLMNVPEESFAQFRPWFLVVLLQIRSLHHAFPEEGVDDFFLKRAVKRSMPVVGLESVEEHAGVFSRMSDRESEILLLINFIPSATAGGKDNVTKTWRRGDADALAARLRRESAEFPAFNERLVDARNRAWVPKIENFLASGHTYFVLVGAGHFGGNNGLLALLRAKGYQIEQL